MEEMVCVSGMMFETSRTHGRQWPNAAEVFQAILMPLVQAEQFTHYKTLLFYNLM